MRRNKLVSKSAEEYLLNWHEPIGSFPYLAPNNDILERFAHLKSIGKLSTPICKRVVELIFIIPLATVLFLPFAIIIFLLAIEILIRGERLGPIYYYYCVSGGIKIKKWKVRVVKEAKICLDLAAQGDWRAWSNEWEPSERLFFGNLAKKFYLDEFPQFISVLRGEMALVGPRPLAELHYQRDLAQGNFTRKILKGGIIGFGHVRKGTNEFGNPEFEFEYASLVETGQCSKILYADFWVIFKAIEVVLRGGGH